MARDFGVPATGKKLLSLPLNQPGMADNKDNPKPSEWPVAVKREKCFTRENAKTFKNIFANPNIVCKLRGPATVDFVRTEFSLS